ncbi:hypothetical protein ACC699_40775, partial [Rhizobium ruizarguesonis]
VMSLSFSKSRNLRKKTGMSSKRLGLKRQSTSNQAHRQNKKKRAQPAFSAPVLPETRIKKLPVHPWSASRR